MTKKANAKHFMIVFGCMLLQAIPFGIAQNIPPLFMSYLTDNFGFSLAGVGLIFTIGAVAASIASPFGGKFYAKMSTRLVMTGGVIMASIGMFMNVFANSLLMFNIANAIIQMGTVIFSGLGVPYLIGTWFDEHNKAKALGIAFAGGSIGNFFLQPIFANLLEKMATNSIAGLHRVYLIAAVAALVTGLVILLFLIRDNKEVANTQAADEEAVVELKGIGAANTRKVKGFWILSFGMFLVGLNIAAQSMQYANYLNHLDLKSVVGTVGSTFAIFCLLGNVGGGVLFSKLGVFKSSVIAFVMQLISAGSMIILGMNPDLTFLAYVWAIFYGFTVFIYMSGPAVMIQDLFGMKESSESLGLFSIFFAVGFALGNVIFGGIVDAMGYTMAWYFVLACIIIGFLVLCSVVKGLERKGYKDMTADQFEG